MQVLVIGSNGQLSWELCRRREKHGVAEAIFNRAKEYISLKVKKVEPISTDEYLTPARRPANSVLDCSLIADRFGIKPKPWTGSLARMIKLMLSTMEAK